MLVSATGSPQSCYSASYLHGLLFQDKLERWGMPKNCRLLLITLWKGRKSAFFFVHVCDYIRKTQDIIEKNRTKNQEVFFLQHKTQDFSQALTSLVAVHLQKMLLLLVVTTWSHHTAWLLQQQLFLQSFTLYLSWYWPSHSLNYRQGFAMHTSLVQ